MQPTTQSTNWGLFTMLSEICFNKGMIPLSRKVHFKVYNPDKPNKYGVKSYHLCDSSNGYCFKFEIYTGEIQDPSSAKGNTYDLVMRLMQPYPNAEHSLYVDMYHTSQIFSNNFEWTGFSVEAGNRRNSTACEHKGSRLFKPKNFPCGYELQKKIKIYSAYDVTCVGG